MDKEILEELKTKSDSICRISHDLYQEGVLTFKASILGRGFDDEIKRAIMIRNDLSTLLKVDLLVSESEIPENISKDLTVLLVIVKTIKRLHK